jgi:hypothetical protein
MPEKYKDEIEEILRRSGEAAPVENASERPVAPEDSPELQDALNQGPQPRRRRFAFSPGKIMLGGLVIFLIAAVTGVSLLIWVGLAILAGAYLLFFVKPSYGPIEKRWRGRVLEAPESRVDRLKKWLKR